MDVSKCDLFMFVESTLGYITSGSVITSFAAENVVPVSLPRLGAEQTQNTFAEFVGRSHVDNDWSFCGHVSQSIDNILGELILSCVGLGTTTEAWRLRTISPWFDKQQIRDASCCLWPVADFQNRIKYQSS